MPASIPLVQINAQRYSRDEIHKLPRWEDHENHSTQARRVSPIGQN